MNVDIVCPMTRSWLPSSLTSLSLSMTLLSLVCSQLRLPIVLFFLISQHTLLQHSKVGQIPHKIDWLFPASSKKAESCSLSPLALVVFFIQMGLSTGSQNSVTCWLEASSVLGDAWQHKTILLTGTLDKSICTNDVQRQPLLCRLLSVMKGQSYGWLTPLTPEWYSILISSLQSLFMTEVLANLVTD